MVSKLSGVRTQIPNRSLVSQATGVDAQALSAYEMDLLQVRGGMGWVGGCMRVDSEQSPGSNLRPPHPYPTATLSDPAAEPGLGRCRCAAAAGPVVLLSPPPWLLFDSRRPRVGRRCACLPPALPPASHYPCPIAQPHPLSPSHANVHVGAPSVLGFLFSQARVSVCARPQTSHLFCLPVPAARWRLGPGGLFMPAPHRRAPSRRGQAVSFVFPLGPAHAPS